MSTKLYDGLKADITTMAEFSDLKRELQNIVERFYVGKFEKMVLSTYETYIKRALKEKHAINIFADSFASALGLFSLEDKKRLEDYNQDLERNLEFAEVVLKNTNIEDDLYYKALLLIAINETIATATAQYSNKMLNFSKERNDLDRLETVIFVFPMEDKCLLYPIGASYVKNGKSYHMLDDIKDIPCVSDYHYQNNSDMPEDVTLEEWEQRIKDWDIALNIESNPLGYLSAGMKVEASNFSALPVKSFLFSEMVEEDVLEFLGRINFDNVIQSIKDDLIFYSEFVDVKISDSVASKFMNNFIKFKENKEDYRKKYSFLDNKFKNLL